MNEEYRVAQSIFFIGIGMALGGSVEFIREIFYYRSFGIFTLPIEFTEIWIVAMALGAVYLEMLVKDRETELLKSLARSEGENPE